MASSLHENISTKRQEMLPTLLDVLRNNRAQRENVLSILHLDPTRRKIAINVLVTDMRRQQVAVEFAEALDSMQDDLIAEEFRKMIEDPTLDARTTRGTLALLAGLFFFAVALFVLVFVVLR